jgi:hypothetical protein
MIHQIVICRRGLARGAGVTTLELLVAFSLLTTVMAVATPLVVRHGRLLASARHYRLALEEVSNQLERLSALPEADVRSALASIEPSAFTAERLPGAEVSGTLTPAQYGARLSVQIVWDEPQRRSAPVSLAAWLSPDPSEQVDNAAREEESP